MPKSPRRGPGKSGPSPKPVPPLKPSAPPRHEAPPVSALGACRVRIFYSGRVQGIGMRATAAGLAARFGITGWVRNLPDERVELLAEGKPEDLERFLAVLGDEMSRYIQSTQRAWETPTGEWSGFESTA